MSQVFHSIDVLWDGVAGHGASVFETRTRSLQGVHPRVVDSRFCVRASATVCVAHESFLFLSLPPPRASLNHTGPTPTCRSFFFFLKLRNWESHPMTKESYLGAREAIHDHHERAQSLSQPPWRFSQYHTSKFLLVSPTSLKRKKKCAESARQGRQDRRDDS